MNIKFSVGDRVFLARDDDQDLLIVQMLGGCIEPVEQDLVFIVEETCEDWFIIVNAENSDFRQLVPYNVPLLPSDFPFRDIVLIMEPLGGTLD